MPEGVKVFWPLSLTKLTFQTKTVFGNWCLKGGISIDADSGSLGYFDDVVVEVEKSLLFFQIGSGHTVQSFKFRL